MSIADDEAEKVYPTRYWSGTRVKEQFSCGTDDLQEAYLLGRNAPPADAEVEAVAKRLLWDSCKRYDDEYVEKGEEETWYRGGCFPGWQKDYYIRQAKELLALARKAVSE